MIETLTGVGLALVPILHLNITVLGTAILSCVAVLVLVKHKNLRLGSKYVYIPLAAITLFAMISDCTMTEKLVSIMLLGVYVLGVNLTEKSTRLLGPAVVVGCISVTAWSIASSSRSGGIYSFNPNIALGAIVMGALLFRYKYQWILTTVALVGLCFTGTEEALAVLGILSLTVLIRRDWSKRLLIPVGVIIIAVALYIPLGATRQIWDTLSVRLDAAVHANMNVATNGRWDVYELTMKDFKPLGHGYEPFNDSFESIHSVPLRIYYELGPIACACWIFVIGYGVVKTKAKYIFVAILALSLFDHFLWTKLSAYMYFAMGASAVVTDDLIFRRGG